MKEIVKIQVSVASMAAQTAHPIQEPYWAYDELRKAFGKYVDTSTLTLRYEGKASSTETDSIIQLLESIGVILIWEKYPFRPGNEGHQLSGIRLFDEADHEMAEYFVMSPEEEIAEKNGSPDADGKLSFNLEGGRTISPLGYAWYGGVCCDKNVKAAIEAEGFENVSFLETRNSNDEIFELSSGLTLPPVLNTVVNEDTGIALPRGERVGCGIQDIFLPHSPIFPARSIPSHFDFARTFETWHFPHVKYAARPWLIVSKRFRNWCTDQGFRVTWIPVQLSD